MSSYSTDSGHTVGKRRVEWARAVERWQGLKVARQVRGSARGSARGARVVERFRDFHNSPQRPNQ
jgi:hypothetical protein